MPTEQPFLARARQAASWLLSALAVIVIAAGVVYVGILQSPGAAPGEWTADDAQRTGITAEEVADPSGMLSRDEAIAHARAIYDPPDPDVRVDAFLIKATDPRSLGTINEVRARPLWIVRYSNVVSAARPGPLADDPSPPRYRYQYLDAISGADLGAQWTR